MGIKITTSYENEMLENDEQYEYQCQETERYVKKIAELLHEAYGCGIAMDIEYDGDKSVITASDSDEVITVEAIVNYYSD